MKFASALLGLALAGTALSASAAGPVNKAAQDRAEAIVKKMTLAEKLSLVHTWFPPMAKPEKPLDLIQSASHLEGIPRLGVPVTRESDASLGVANQVEQRKGDTATALPAGLATAASFDPAIAREGGAMIGAEARAKRFNVLLAGGVNLTRDPWNGRNFEYLGEDALLAGTMAGEAIAGVQSNNIVSTIKHFALNSQETGRHVLDARIDPAALQESDLLAFKIAIEKGRPGSVMCAYNKVNGDWACENDALLNGVLKGEWQYPGWVMSDWGAVHTTVKAALAGLDQQSGQELDPAMYFGRPLAVAIGQGDVPMARLDDMVTRFIYGLIDTGTFDHPIAAGIQPIDYAAHARVAQRAAEEGIVLLKNEGNLLPAAKTAKKIVLIGGHADVGVLSGGGSSQVRSVGGVPVEIALTEGQAASFARTTWHSSSPLRAIKALAPQAQVTYVDGRNAKAAAAAARGADLAIVFAWQWQTEAQDVETMALPEKQDALIEAVAKANRKTLVVLETGGPVLMPWVNKVPAILAAWYPGQRGGEAIANILFGDVSPSGRLPITFPVRAEDAPRPAPVGLANLHAADARRAADGNVDYGQSAGIAPFAVEYPEGANVGYRWYEMKATKPLFPFGHGLTYTAFRYSGLQVQGGDGLKVTFDVTNTGRRAGVDVPQVYVRAADSKGVKTFRLVGWDKVTLAPGQVRRVTVTVDPRTIARYDMAAKGWQLDAGSYDVAVGPDAQTRALIGVASLAAKTMKP